MSRYIFPLLLLIPQVYLLFRFLRWHKAFRKLPPALFRAVVGLFLVFNIALLATMFLRIFSLRFSDGVIAWVVYPFLFWHSSTFIVAFVLLLGLAVKSPFKAVWSALRHLPWTRKPAAVFAAQPRVVRFNEARRSFLRKSVYGLNAASFGGTAYGMFVGKNDCDITMQEIHIPGLPRAWDGFSIGLVTDIHSSLYMRKSAMDSYVRRLNDLGTDIFAVGGDLVNGSVEEIYPFAEAFSKLSAPMGVYGVLGNHDFYSRDPEGVARVAGQAGIRMLRDEGITLKRQGSTLHILGIDDTGAPSSASKQIREALSQVQTKGPKILLCHRPYFLQEAASLGIDLMLSGHTHGGQLVFGRVGSMTFTPAAFASSYVWGHYRHDKAQMYVSRGIGTVAVPVRINCPPELTRIVIRSS